MATEANTQKDDNLFGARAARLQLSNDISQPRGLVVANMNYLGKPTQGKGFAVVTLTKPLSRPDLSRTDRCISLRDRTKKAEPLTRAARRAQRVQDRPRRRRRSGRSCATERSEGAPVLAQRPAALARSFCKLCEAQRAERHEVQGRDLLGRKDGRREIVAIRCSSEILSLASVI